MMMPGRYSTRAQHANAVPERRHTKTSRQRRVRHPSQYRVAEIRDIVRGLTGTAAPIEIVRWYLDSDSYAIVAVKTSRPALRLIVKLELPGRVRDRRFESVAAVARLVRAQTSVPTFEVVACDVTRSKWPWNVLIVNELRGSTWAELHPRLSAAEQAPGQRLIGRAAAELHMLQFAAFGPIEGDGSVTNLGGAMRALEARATQRIKAAEHRDRMLQVLERYKTAFATVQQPRLVHDDLNPYNLLFDVRDGNLVVTGVLDFESAWAGVAESDLARLDLWRLTRGTALRQGYSEISAIPDDKAATVRQLVLQLLWCLEYADEHRSAAHQADTDDVCAKLGMSRMNLSHG
jgi:aminoglycoside phosphotransferase (APT) family kinase protein